MGNQYVYMAIAALLTIILVTALLTNDRVKAIISKNKFSLNAGKAVKSNKQATIKDVKNNSDIDIKTKPDRNYHIERINRSNIKID